MIDIEVEDAAYGDVSEIIAKGDGLEVSPVIDDGECCYVCEEGEETMWSVYVHLDGEGVQCIADFEVKDYVTRAAAEGLAFAYAKRLLELYPQLLKHGINNSHSGGNKR